MYQQGDKVIYVGSRFVGDINVKVGEVCARVQNAPEEFVVDFGGDAYVLRADHLQRWRPSAKDLKEGRHEPEISRKRKYDEDEE